MPRWNFAGLAAPALRHEPLNSHRGAAMFNERTDGAVSVARTTSVLIRARRNGGRLVARPLDEDKSDSPRARPPFEKPLALLVPRPIRLIDDRAFIARARALRGNSLRAAVHYFAFLHRDGIINFLRSMRTIESETRHYVGGFRSNPKGHRYNKCSL